MKLTIFQCDSCGNKSDAKDSDDLFENDKWLYLRQLDLQIKGYGGEKLHDKHFCCIECFNTVIAKLINENR